MAADGTMAGYCDVLSGYHEGDALPFSVYRADNRANLKGTLNGKAIEPDFAFAVALGDGTSGPPQDWATRSTTLRGNLSVDAPPEWKWKTTRGSSTTKRVGPGMYVAPSVAAFVNGLRAPGAFVAASASLAEDAARGRARLLSPGVRASSTKCTLTGRTAFTRGGYDGIFDRGTDAAAPRLAIPHDRGEEDRRQPYRLHPVPGSQPADLAILDRMLVTLKFDPNGA